MEPATKPLQIPAEAREEIAPIDVVVAEVRADANRDPSTYLRETIVPEGGE